MSDPVFSDIYIKNQMALVRTSLKMIISDVEAQQRHQQV